MPLRETGYLRLILTLTLLTTLNFTPAAAQHAISDEPEASAVFARLFGGREAADRLVTELKAFQTKSPYSANAVLHTARKLAVGGLSQQFINQAVKACGDVAAASDATDETFARCALTLGEMRAGDGETYDYLSALEQYGIPAWGALSDVLQLPTEQIRVLSWQQRLRPAPTIHGLIEGWRRKYYGLAEEIAQKRRR